MDIAPIYELQTRLRSAAIAGVNLLQEDFRLKRAAEAVKPLEGASPVFAKLNQQMTQLLSADCENPTTVLLETITLADAVVCTLGAVEAAGEMEDLEIAPSAKAVTVNAPYSQLSALVKALTTSGSGNYALVEETCKTQQDIFQDYRVYYAMVQALGASYAMLADLVKEWFLSRNDASVIPLLKKDFNPRGRKEMVRRLEIIGAIAGEKENDFYRTMLADAEKEIRFELIRLLQYEPSNTDLLLNLVKTEKGKHKERALRSLGCMNDDRVMEVYEDIAKKKTEKVCEYLIASTSESASKMITRLCMDLLSKLLASKEEQKLSKSDICKNCHADERNCPLKKTLKYRFFRCVEALIGKSGDEVIECYKAFLENRVKLDCIIKKDDILYNIITPDTDKHSWPWQQCGGQRLLGWNDTGKRPWEQVIGMHLANSLVVRDNPQIADFVMKQYENGEGTEKNFNFLTAAAFIKICSDKNCAAWLDKQMEGGNYSENHLDKKTAIKAIMQYIRWDSSRHAYVAAGHIQWYDEDIYEGIKRTIDIPDHSAIIDWMMQAGWEELVYSWTNKDDVEECARVGEWFYDKCLKLQEVHGTREPLYRYLEYLRGCKWIKCEGLGSVFASACGRFFAREPWQIREFFAKDIPGSRENIMSELDAFIKLAQEHTIKGMTDE
nr:hypothetical protein [Lachnospiraceae bacterium]